MKQDVGKDGFSFLSLKPKAYHLGCKSLAPAGASYLGIPKVYRRESRTAG
jgi:hypothetical protein